MKFSAILSDAYEHSRKFENEGIYVRIIVELMGLHVEAWVEDSWGKKSRSHNRIVSWYDAEQPELLKLNIDKVVVCHRLDRAGLGNYTIVRRG